MGRIIFLILILSTFFAFTTQANDSTLQLQLIKSIAGSYKNFEVDNLGNVYLISKNNQVKKMSPTLDSMGVYNDTRRLGNITAIDVTNPLKILVFYKDFSTIIVLDRFLNMVNAIDLRAENLLQVSCIASSYDNNIWLFDELENQVKKIDEFGKVILKFTDLRLLFEKTFLPNKMIDNDGKLYLHDTENGLLTFNYYGAFYNNYSIVGLSDISILEGKLNGFLKNDICEFDLRLMLSKSKKISNCHHAIKRLIVAHNTLFCLSKQQLECYLIK